MAAYTSGTSWSFPKDLPGGWVKVGGEEKGAPDATSSTQSPSMDEEGKYGSRSTAEPSGAFEGSRHEQSRQSDTESRRRRTHYPPRQCRICLDVVQPTFQNVEPLSSSLPSAFQPAPRVTYASPPGDGGRLLRPCKCKGSQKYVHEECLSAWRMQDPLQKRNYWQCPTCLYKYQLQRLTWGSWITSTAAQVGLTITIFVVTMFLLGFVADPIINLYLDPVNTIATRGGPTGSLVYEDEPATWVEHFVKGLASLGLLGFAKFFMSLGPWQWFRGFHLGGSGGRANTGRDRLNQLSWVAILVGIATFLYAVWKGVRAWSRRTLEKAGERVMDVPGANDDDDEENDDTR